MKLKISPDLKLPLDAVTQTFGILAVRGVGKTYTATVMAEEMLKAGLPIVVVDPIGVWFGLRSSADGKDVGLPIIIFGGEHADVPLEVTSGELVADLVVAERISIVLDLSLFRKGEQIRFMTDFAERLYHKNRDALHVFVDEADAYCPQKPQKGAERLLGAMEDLVRRGRARGIGLTLITQRAAVINKNVLTQISVLVALRTVSPQDRAAIDSWIQVHGTEEERDELMESLPSLPIGTAWFWSPGWLDIFQRVKVRTRETFDSSATPKVGEKIRTPKKLAEIDLSSIREKIAGTIERAKSEDPKHLKAEITRLKKELSYKNPMVDTTSVDILVRGAKTNFENQVKTLKRNYGTIIRDLVTKLTKIAKLSEVEEHLLKEVEELKEYKLQEVSSVPPKVNYKADIRPSASVGSRHVTVITNTSGNLPGGERKILTVLAQYPSGRSKSQIGILTGYAAGGGGFANYMSSLRTKGFIDGRGEKVTITREGIEALGDYTALPTGRKLLEYWQGRLGRAEREILEVLACVYPDSLSKEDIAINTLSKYAPSGGGFANALSKLRSLELIEGRGEMKLSDSLV